MDISVCASAANGSRAAARARARWGAGLIAAAALGASCASLPEPFAAASPAAGSPVDSGMVAAAHPLAVEAGVEMLRSGGTAVDAAVAVQAMLGLVEPQSSGLGGGAFLVFYDAGEGTVSAYDGREEAPGGATPDMFLDADGAPLGYFPAKNSGRSIGAPGAVDMLALAHADHGALPWARAFEPATTTAREGFAVTERLNLLVGLLADRGLREEGGEPADAASYLFGSDGAPLPVGHILTNPAYADTLEAIAANPRALNEGPIAAAIAARAQEGPRAGTLTVEDLAAYRARRVEPVCSDYRELRVCGAPPPSSGGVAIGMFLSIVELAGGFSAEGADDPANWALFADAQRLAYADRDHFVADDRFAPVPVAGLLDRAYLAERAALISPERAIATARHGAPPEDAAARGRDASDDGPGTSHFVVVDAAGNVVSMTTTVEGPFGSSRMVGGMFLNNQLTDFSKSPVDDAGTPIANAVAPRKRPRSSMSPTIVLDADGAFLLATGSPGGNSIIAYTAKSLVGMLDWGLTPQEAADLPNLVARGDTVRIEESRASPALIEALRAHGFEIRTSSRGENSGIHTVLRRPDGSLVGAADSRREGVVATP